MKLTFTTLAVLILSFVIHVASAQCIDATVCFRDGYGAVYRFSNPVLVGINIYMAEGTCTTYEDGTATIWLDLSRGIDNGKVKLMARKGIPDNCRKNTDSFSYAGNVQIVKEGNNTISFAGSGTWISYCHGEQFGQGKWSAKGPCNTLNNNLQQQNSITPADGNEVVQQYKKGIVTSPNPAINFTTITCYIKDAGKANITIYNSMNQPVAVLMNEVKSPGTYTIQWNLQSRNGAKVPTGIYRAVLTTASGTWYNSVQVLGN